MPLQAKDLEFIEQLIIDAVQELIIQMQKTMVAVAERDLPEEAARDLHHANDQNLLLDEKLKTPASVSETRSVITYIYKKEQMFNQENEQSDHKSLW